MVKRHEYTSVYVLVRVDRFHRPDLPADHHVTAIEAVPTIAEAWAERDRLNALARQGDINDIKTEYVVSKCRWYPEGRSVTAVDEHRAVIAGTWVWSGNVEAVFETLSRWIGYDFDGSDWVAVEHGLVASDAEADRWFEYPLVGQVRLDVGLAREPGADPVSVRLSSNDAISDQLRIRIETGLELFNCYRISTPSVGGPSLPAPADLGIVEF